MHAVAVFCGSRMGAEPEHAALTRALGAAVARRGVTLVYGGAQVGLMGAVADAALAEGGTVVGVIPEALVEREMAHDGLTRLDVVADMAQRKIRMMELVDAAIALPGGIGTLDELFELWTHRHLGLWHGALGLLSPDAYYAPLEIFVDRMVDAGYLSAQTRAALVSGHDPDTLLDQLIASERS